MDKKKRNFNKRVNKKYVLNNLNIVKDINNDKSGKN